jgi:acetate kinase
MSDCIATINAGSSSIKFALYEAEGAQRLLYRGKIEQIGVSPSLTVADVRGRAVAAQTWDPDELDHRKGTQEILNTAASLLRGRRVAGAGHRVVHGGTNYAAPVRVDNDVIKALATLAPLAPLHQPHNLSPIMAIADAAPHVPQVACFDTAFHRSQPDIAQLFGLPRRLAEEGVRRYGFHGLSYEYVTAHMRELAPELAEGRLIIAHLGNGASLCATRRGQSVATTMGFTAVDGLIMGTRCGALDPGVLLYLMDTHDMDPRAIEDLIYRESGLLGVSGISSDMQRLRASSDPAAAEAIALFVYRIVREIGSLSAALGGLDALIFTAGIGENEPGIRAAVADGCAWLGLDVDEARNARGSGRISSDASRVSVWVVPTDEERMILRHTSQLLGVAAATTSHRAAAAGGDATGM